MSSLKKFIRVGYVRKKVGLQGHLIISLEPRGLACLDHCDYLFYHDEGQKIPVFILEFEPGEDQHIIKFEDIDSPEVAARLVGSELFQDEAIIAKYGGKEEDEMLRSDLDQLAGYRIKDEQSEEFISILEVREFPQQLMAVYLSGEDEKYLPLDDSLIISIDPENKIIFTRYPEGIFDI